MTAIPEAVFLNDSTTADRTLVIERVFEAPPELVFEAWTKPEHLAKWLGPYDFTLPHCEMDFRVGGRYRFCMRSPEDDDHWVWGEYQEIVVAEKIAFTWNREDAAGNIWNRTLVSLTFSGDGGRTRFVLRQELFDTIDDRDDHNIGWNQSLNRLSVFMEGTNGK